MININTIVTNQTSHVKINDLPAQLKYLNIKEKNSTNVFIKLFGIQQIEIILT